MRITGGEARGRRLRAPKDPHTRPTGDRVREAIFDILGPRIAGARFLDLFAGTGAVGIDALSRGAARAVFVEIRRSNFELIRDNLGIGDWSGRGEVIEGAALNAIDLLLQRGDRFEVIFLDPPYDGTDVAVVLAAAAPLLSDEGRLVAEHRTDQPPPEVTGLRRRKAYRHGDTSLSLFETIPTSRGAGRESGPASRTGLL